MAHKLKDLMEGRYRGTVISRSTITPYGLGKAVCCAVHALTALTACDLKPYQARCPLMKVLSSYLTKSQSVVPGIHNQLHGNRPGELLGMHMTGRIS